MTFKRSPFKAAALVLAAIVLLSVPLAAGAQTTANGITSPAAGATVSGVVEVRGYANDPNFSKWQLDLLPSGQADAAIFLAVGLNSGVFTYTLDTTNYPAGEHALRLRVVRTDGNYNEYTTNFVIGAAKATARPAAAAPAAAATPVATRPVTTTVAAATTTVTRTVAATTAAATTNGITNPKAGATVSGVVEVRGYANDPDFSKWQLDLLPSGQADAAIFLAVGLNSGVFTYTLDTANFPAVEHALRLRVVRNDSNYNEYTTNFVIGAAKATARPAAAAAAPVAAATPAVTTTVTTTVTAATKVTAKPAALVNGITSPAEGATVRGTVEVKGYANDPNFNRWQLDLLPSRNADAATFLAVGLNSGVFTYTLDTTNYPAGEHALRLRVVRNDSNYDEYTTNFVIAK